MSYSASFTVGAEGDEKSIAEQLDGMSPQTSPAGVEGAFGEHLTVLRDTLDELAAVVGRQSKWRVTVSGHANPDHAPVEGWGDEFISLRIEALHEQVDVTP